MSPVTHFFASWVLASFPRLERRDVALVTLAGVAPDIDGIGIVPELLTRNSTHPLDWFSRYHHVLAHNLLFARRRWTTAPLALIAVHLHFFMDVLGSRGPDGYNWPIPYFELFSSRVQMAWSGQWALRAWQNIVVTLALLVWTMVRAVQIGRSPVEIFSPSADKKVVAALRHRWSRTAAEE